MRSFLGRFRVERRGRADSFRLSVPKNGVTQMFIIAAAAAAARRGKNVDGIFLRLASAPRTVCINLNGNCGDVSRLIPSPSSPFQHLFLTLSPSPAIHLPCRSFCLSSFLNNSPLFAVCYPEELSLFPAATTTYFRLVPS